MERQKTDKKDAVSTTAAAADESIYNCDETTAAAAEE